MTTTRYSVRPCPGPETPPYKPCRDGRTIAVGQSGPVADRCDPCQQARRRYFRKRNSPDAATLAAMTAWAGDLDVPAGYIPPDPTPTLPIESPLRLGGLMRSAGTWVTFRPDGPRVVDFDAIPARPLRRVLDRPASVVVSVIPRGQRADGESIGATAYRLTLPGEPGIASTVDRYGFGPVVTSRREPVRRPPVGPDHPFAPLPHTCLECGSEGPLSTFVRVGMRRGPALPVDDGWFPKGDGARRRGDMFRRPVELAEAAERLNGRSARFMCPDCLPAEVAPAPARMLPMLAAPETPREQDGTIVDGRPPAPALVRLPRRSRNRDAEGDHWLPMPSWAGEWLSVVEGNIDDLPDDIAAALAEQDGGYCTCPDDRPFKAGHAPTCVRLAIGLSELLPRGPLPDDDEATARESGDPARFAEDRVSSASEMRSDGDDHGDAPGTLAGTYGWSNSPLGYGASTVNMDAHTAAKNGESLYGNPRRNDLPVSTMDTAERLAAVAAALSDRDRAHDEPWDHKGILGRSTPWQVVASAARRGHRRYVVRTGIIGQDDHVPPAERPTPAPMWADYPATAPAWVGYLLRVRRVNGVPLK